MANPTTNFGWVMPTATDLVTDLPADFNVFGQGVDTSMQYLLGGTTGQVLSKTSGTNMAFTWVTPTDQTPLTTKGDLFTYTTADARLGVGTNGQILSANSAQATGLEWVTPNPGDITAVNVTSPITGGGTSGDVTISIQDASTAQKGSVQLSDSTSTTSSVLASTPTAVKSAYDLANAAIAKSVVTTAGDIIYRNATVPTRLAIGTASQVLQVNAGATAPEWTTLAPAASGLTKIVTGNFSASGGVAINGCFTSTYTNYMVVINSLGDSTNPGTVKMNFQYSTSTVANGAEYYWAGNNLNSAGTATTFYANGGTSVTLGYAASNQRHGFVINICNVGNGSNEGYYSCIGNGAVNGISTSGGIIVQPRTYTGLYLTGQGNISGTYTVYGLAK